nr:aldehyde dehydrogenase family protein [Paraburkholderia youngii]
MSLSPAHQHPLDVPGRLFIGGAFVEGDGDAIEHVNPSTGRPQAVVRLASASDIDRAVKAAKAAQRVWTEMGPRARTRCFRRLGELLEANQQQLAFLGARESGIPVGLPLMDMALGWVDHYMGWIDKIEGSYGESYPAPGFNYTRREPYGVVGVIIPWNGPLMATCMMALPAMASF